MGKQEFSFNWLILPFLVFLVLGLSMVFERSGVEYEIRYPPLQFLPQINFPSGENEVPREEKTLVIFDSDGIAGMDHPNTVFDTLDSMRVPYDSVDIQSNTPVEFSDYRAVVISFIEIQKINNEILELLDWVEEGGRVMFSIRPDPSETFQAIYRKLGIISTSSDFLIASGIEFTSPDLLPGVEGQIFGEEFLFHRVNFYSLEETSKVHAVSADEFRIPLVWEYAFGNGHIVVVNSDQFNDKSSRGIIGGAYSLLFDAFVYPVINASAFFIDDFPAPLPEGENETITEIYGRNLRDFFINIWWPDLQAISRDYEIMYSTMIIETYNDDLTPPFVKQPEIERHQYFGGLVLDGGGELGLHGYNHVPLCQTNDDVNQVLDYPEWESLEAIELSIFEAFSFTRDIFPEYEIKTYVPPSNVLCEEARTLLPQLLPDLKVISSVYLEAQAGLAYKQEFKEAPDGIIEFPRISTGYDVGDYYYWASANELGLHYVSSHYFHPFGAEFYEADGEWEKLVSGFEDYVSWLSDSAPELRNFTAQEGAMATQRFSRLVIGSQKYADGELIIQLEYFYDEAWLMLRSYFEPTDISGGELFRVNENSYLIKVTEPNLVISLSE